MHFSLSNLTLAALVVHTVFGCCFHHEHVSVVGTGSVMVTGGEDACCPCRHANPSGSEEPSGPARGNQGKLPGCQGTRCEFVRLLQEECGGLDDVSDGTSQAAPAIIPVPSPVSASAGPGPCPYCAATCRPAVPLHLAKQVLLI